MVNHVIKISLLKVTIFFFLEENGMHLHLVRDWTFSVTGTQGPGHNNKNKII